MRAAVASLMIAAVLLAAGCSPDRGTARKGESPSSPSGSWVAHLSSSLNDDLETLGATVETVGPYPAPDEQVTNVRITIPEGTRVATRDPFIVVARALAVGRDSEMSVTFENLMDDGTRYVTSYRWKPEGSLRKYEGRLSHSEGEAVYELTGETSGMTADVVQRVAGGVQPAPLIDP